jgi:hypothetical protein
MPPPVSWVAIDREEQTVPLGELSRLIICFLRIWKNSDKQDSAKTKARIQSVDLLYVLVR